MVRERRDRKTIFAGDRVPNAFNDFSGSFGNLSFSGYPFPL
jgi:hypothetical protein